MDFNIGDLVLFEKTYNATVIGFKEKSIRAMAGRKEILINFSEEVGLVGGGGRLGSAYTLDDKKINISDYTKCYWVFSHEIIHLNEKPIEENINIKEDLSMEKLILKKLIKMQKL